MFSADATDCWRRLQLLGWSSEEFIDKRLHWVPSVIGVLGLLPVTLFLGRIQLLFHSPDSSSLCNRHLAESDPKGGISEVPTPFVISQRTDILTKSCPQRSDWLFPVVSSSL